jgi:hypothetical protein
MFADVSHLTQLTSCVGANSCGLGAPTLFGATSITATNVGEGYLASADNGNGASFAMTGSNQGMFNSYAAISSFWSDTTAMDNLRAADITATSVAGSLETIGANTAANNVRGGHTVHDSTTSAFGA